MTEWLSCGTKTNMMMMETVIMLFLGAGKKKGPLGREQYVHVLRLLPGRISNKSVYTISLQDDVLFQHWVLALTAQTSRAVSASRWCTRLGKGVKTRNDYEVKKKTNE